MCRNKAHDSCLCPFFLGALLRGTPIGHRLRRTHSCLSVSSWKKSWKKLEKVGKSWQKVALYCGNCMYYVSRSTSVGLRQSVYVSRSTSVGLRQSDLSGPVLHCWHHCPWILICFFYLITAHLQLVSTPLSMHRQSLFPIDILLWLYLLFRLYLKYQLTVDRATIGAIGPSINRLLIDYELCSLTLMYSFQFYHSKNMNKKLKFEHNMHNRKTHLMMLKSSL